MKQQKVKPKVRLESLFRKDYVLWLFTFNVSNYHDECVIILQMDGLARPGTGEPGGQGTHGPVGLSTRWPGGASTHESGGPCIREPGGPSTRELGGPGTRGPGGLSSRDLQKSFTRSVLHMTKKTLMKSMMHKMRHTCDDELEENINSTQHGKTITRKETRALSETRKSCLNKKNLAF
ncbi:hypothetical protein Tco_1278160 [Tanacetum coccineum]